jgi:DNA-binding CsgD family transcriptional regulator
MPARSSEYCPRHAQGAPVAAPIHIGTPEAGSDRASTIAAAVSELLDEGLAHVQISARLGLTAAEVKEAVRLARQPDHGLPERWYRGCRCAKCTQAVHTDPLVLQVGELRRDGLVYAKIAEQLDIPQVLAEKAGHASGVKRGIPHGRRARWRAGCRCEACTEAAPKEAPAAQIETQARHDGLAKNRLDKKGLVKTRIHGTPVRWRAGCRCLACVTAVRQDPLVIQVAELRNTGMGYKEIAAQLEITVAKAEEAGGAAGFKGPGGPTSVAPPACSWPACDSPALTGTRCAFHQDWAKRGFDPDNPATKDDFPSELRAAIILKAVELLLGGLSYADVGKRLGISSKITEGLCRDAGYTDVARRPAANQAAVTFPRRSEKWDLASPAGFGAAPRRSAVNKAGKTFGRHGEQWDRLVASAGALLGEGLTTTEIAERLGVSYGSAAKACRWSAELSNVHGIPVKWHTGCRCDTCLEAMRRDTLITAVAEKRSRNVSYEDISAYLGSTPARIRRAGLEARDCGLIDSIRAQRAAAAPPVPKSIPVDGFTPAVWAELVDAVGTLKESGLRYALIGRRLGVSTAVARQAGRMVGKETALVERTPPPADPKELSEVPLQEDGVGWIPLDTYVHMTAPEDASPTSEDVSPEVHVRTPEEWAELVRTVGELRQAGLSIKKISQRLGITPRTASDACEESSFDGTPARPPHGTRTRWRTGCSCDLCTEAKDADPQIAEVRRLRGERKSYPEIARILGISPATAWQVGKDAGFSGWPERPADEPSPREKELAQRAADRASAGSHFHPWTEAEERTVRESDLPARELAATLGRTPAAINNKRKELASNDDGPRTRKRRSKSSLPRPWTQEEDQVVMDEDLTGREQADKLGRSYAAVLTRRNTLRRAAGKPKRESRPWTPEDLATARREDVPVKELAAMLGRTTSSVYAMRHRA